MTDAAHLYETDFTRWAEGQAKLLREAGEAGNNLPLDWRNLAEEVDCLGQSQRNELRSRLGTVMEHLLKLAVSPAIEPRPGCKSTVRRERDEIEALLEINRSLRRELAPMIERDVGRVVKRVTDSLSDHGEDEPAALAKLRRVRFTDEQILGDWFPGDPT